MAIRRLLQLFDSVRKLADEALVSEDRIRVGPLLKHGDDEIEKDDEEGERGRVKNRKQVPEGACRHESHYEDHASTPDGH